MRQIGVGILGFGTVGAGVAAGLLKNRTLVAERTGLDIVLRKIADLDITTDRGVSVDPAILCTNAFDVIADPDVDIIIELIGGCGIARDLVRASIEAGKPVVTANKKLLAEHGREVFALAREHGVDIFFGASVGGGIPIIRSLRDGLAGNRIESVHGILNGTCNYILTRMGKEGLSFDAVLKSAQEQGYAEAEPSLDVDGYDTLHKASIIAALAYGVQPDIKTLSVEGIRGVVDAADIGYAEELGYRIKLLAIIRNDEGAIEIRVAPTLVPIDGMLASVSGVFNAVLIKSDLAGKTLYYGRGAGRMPTASTVIGDVVDAARNLVSGTPRAFVVPETGTPHRIKNSGEEVSKFYVRLAIRDIAGAFAVAAGILGRHGVSISAAIQKDSGDGKSGFATVIVVTHASKRSDVNAALKELSFNPISGADPRCLGIAD